MKKTIIFISVVVLMVLGIYLASMLTSDGGDQLPDVKIGFIGPLSGDAAIYGKAMKQGLELARTQMAPNIEIIYEDTACEAERVVSAMNRLLADEKIVAIIGEACSGATLAAAPMAEHEEVVLISPASTSPEISQAGKFIYRTAISDAFQGECAAKLVDVSDTKRLAILHGDEPYGIGYANAMVEAHEVHESYEIVGVFPFERLSTDFTQQIQQIKDSQADSVMIVSNSIDSAVEAVKQIKAKLPQVRLFGSEGMQDQSVMDRSGNAAEGLTLVSITLGTEAFMHEYRVKYGTEPGLFAAHAYDAFEAVFKGLEAGADNGERLATELNQIDFDGASGRIFFDSNGDVKSTCFKSTIENGQLTRPTSF